MMKFNYFLLFSLICVFPLKTTYGSTGIATVTKIRGTVTKLLPGALEASIVNLGDVLIEDTSLVSSSKSFVKLKFIDNSQLSMGPESKIVVNVMAQGKPGIISLLKGRIRTEVEKTQLEGNKDKNKFYIRTRTAAMGVRGTDFQTIYNPENHVTSVLTYKGAVALTKMDEATHELFEGHTTEVSRVENSDKLTLTKIEGAPVNEQAQLSKLLNKQDTVIVLAGQNAFSSNDLKKSSAPVKISTAQFNALFKNKDFNEKNILNLKAANTEKELKPIVETVSQSVPVEGFFNKETGDFNPRAGGYIDLSSGLYIAPDSNSSFDDKNKIYLAKNIGDIDSDTGEYFPPEGLSINPFKGFVVINESNARVETLSKREDLNLAISKAIVLGNKEEINTSLVKARDEKFIRNYLTVGLSVGTYQIQVNKNQARPFTEGQESSAKKLNLEYQFSSKNRLTTLVGLSFAKTEYNLVSSQMFSKNTSSLWTLSAGAKYAINADLDIIGLLTLDQKDIAETTSLSPDTLSITKAALTKISGTALYEILKYEKLSLSARATGSFSFRKRYNYLVINNIKSYMLGLTPSYKIDEKKIVSLGFYRGFDYCDVTDSFGTNKEEHSESGLELKFTHAF